MASTERSRGGKAARAPTWFAVLRFVARALQVDAPQPIPALRGKQLQRFYRGRLDEISPDTVWAILCGLVGRYLVEDPVVVRVLELPEEPRARQQIASLLCEHLAAWEDLSMRLAAKYGASPGALRRAWLSQLRFAALELGIFVGYFCVQAGRPAPVGTAFSWNVRIAQDRTLRNLVKKSASRPALVRALRMKHRRTVDAWCDAGKRPRDVRLGEIAKVLAPGESPERLRQGLRSHFAMRQFVNDLERVVGWSEVQELVAAVVRTAQGTVSYLAGTRVIPSLKSPLAKFVLARWMLDAPSHKLVVHLLAHEPTRRWRAVLRALREASRTVRPSYAPHPAGGVRMVTRYPRIACMTDFDFEQSDLFVAAAPAR